MLQPTILRLMALVQDSIMTKLITTHTFPYGGFFKLLLAPLYAHSMSTPMLYLPLHVIVCKPKQITWNSPLNVSLALVRTLYSHLKLR